jgi:hypothetical protein
MKIKEMKEMKEKMRLILSSTVTQSIGCGGVRLRRRPTHLVKISGGSHGVQGQRFKNYRTACWLQQFAAAAATAMEKTLSGKSCGHPASALLLLR